MWSLIVNQYLIALSDRVLGLTVGWVCFLLFRYLNCRTQMATSEESQQYHSDFDINNILNPLKPGSDEYRNRKNYQILKTDFITAGQLKKNNISNSDSKGTNNTQTTYSLSRLCCSSNYWIFAIGFRLPTPAATMENGGDSCDDKGSCPCDACRESRNRDILEEAYETVAEASAEQNSMVPTTSPLISRIASRLCTGRANTF